MKVEPDIVTVSSGPGIRAPDRATVKDVVKIAKNSTIYNLWPFPFLAPQSVFRWGLLSRLALRQSLKKNNFLSL